MSVVERRVFAESICELQTSLTAGAVGAARRSSACGLELERSSDSGMGVPRV